MFRDSLDVTDTLTPAFKWQFTSNLKRPISEKDFTEFPGKRHPFSIIQFNARFIRSPEESIPIFTVHWTNLHLQEIKTKFIFDGERTFSCNGIEATGNGYFYAFISCPKGDNDEWHVEGLERIWNRAKTFFKLPLRVSWKFFKI